MSPFQLNNWVAKHRWIVCTAAAILVALALIGSLYRAGWRKETGNTDHRSYFKILPGEHLEYEATSYMGAAGTVMVDVAPLMKHDDGSGSYRITYTLESSKKVSAIYVMKGQVVAIVDATTLLPIEFEEKMRTGLAIKGAEYKHKKLVYDRTKNEVAYYKLRKKSENKDLRFKGVRPIPPDSHHFTSLLYYMRFIDFTPGKEVLIPMSDRKRDLTIKVTVHREKDYESHDGTTRKAIVLETVTDFGKEDMEGAKFRIWLDKKERYPVRIRTDLKWGTVKLKLVKRTVKEAPAGASK